MDFSSSVSVIIVSYQSAAVLSHAILSLREAPEVAEIIVVDNTSTDGTLQLGCLQHHKIRLLPQKENLGFGHANNVALRAVQTPYVLLLNPDATMDEASLLRGLMKLASDQQIGILAPLLHDSQQQVQESYKRNIFSREKERCPFIIPNGPLCAEFLSGAVWLARTDVLRQIGGFDEKIFLFYEDDDVCLRLRNAGYSLVLDPTMRAFHAVGKSSPPSQATLALKQFHLTYSRIYIELKYNGTGAARSLVNEWSWRLRSKWLWATLTGSSKRHRYAARLRGCNAAKRLLVNTGSAAIF